MKHEKEKKGDLPLCWLLFPRLIHRHATVPGSLLWIHRDCGGTVREVEVPVSLYRSETSILFIGNLIDVCLNHCITIPLHYNICHRTWRCTID
jgi:hypothetical protein